MMNAYQRRNIACGSNMRSNYTNTVVDDTVRGIVNANISIDAPPNVVPTLKENLTKT